MKSLTLLLGLAVVGLTAGGCGSSQSSATADETKAWKSPPKTPPAGYDKWMADHKNGASPSPAGQTK